MAPQQRPDAPASPKAPAAQAQKAAKKQAAREAKADLYRQLVLEAARGVFAEKGYDDAKIGEIAEASGVSLQTLYSVFPGKGALYEAVQVEGDEALHRLAIDASLTTSEPLDSMLAGMRATTLYFLEQPDFLRLRLHGGLTWGTEAMARGAAHQSEAWRQALERLQNACERCIDAGALVARDPQLIARTIVSMQQVELAHWLEGGMTADPIAVADALESQVKRAFCREPRPL